MHIGKTGGTAIKRTLHSAGFAYRREGGERNVSATPFGPIKLETHRFVLKDLPEGEHVFFCVRDPVARFVSGFHSRRGAGGEAYGQRFPWTDLEKQVFARFDTPEQLALALGSDDAAERELAQWAMKHVRHLGPQRRFTGPGNSLRDRMDQIVYIARQETLETDWEQLKLILRLPPELALISDAARAHRRADRGSHEFDPAAVRNLRDWYALDYGLLEIIEDLRAENGWGPKRRGARLASELRRTARRARRILREASPRRELWH